MQDKPSPSKDQGPDPGSTGMSSSGTLATANWSIASVC